VVSATDWPVAVFEKTANFGAETGPKSRHLGRYIIVGRVLCNPVYTAMKDLGFYLGGLGFKAQ
jgi:hypothetical protein